MMASVGSIILGSSRSSKRRLRAADALIQRITRFQILGEKGREFVERDKLHPVVEIDVAGAGNDEQFLGLTGKPVSLFTELFE